MSFSIVVAILPRFQFCDVIMDRKNDILQEYEKMQQDMVNFRRALLFAFGDFEKRVGALEGEKTALQEQVTSLTHADPEIEQMDLLDSANATIER